MLLSLSFVAAGVSHFVATDFFVSIANVHMALHPEAYVAGGTPLWALFLRLPLQFVFIAWALWATRPERSPVAGARA